MSTNDTRSRPSTPSCVPETNRVETTSEPNNRAAGSGYEEDHKVEDLTSTPPAAEGTDGVHEEHTLDGEEAETGGGDGDDEFDWEHYNDWSSMGDGHWDSNGGSPQWVPE